MNMEHSRQYYSETQAIFEKKRAAVLSVAAAILLTVLKLAVGLWTNSLGILSEALHSGLDLAAAVVTLFAIRVSARPADRDHTYGHGKIENLSALFETLLLLATCVWIIHEAVSRLFLNEVVEIRPSIWAFAVMFVSILVDIGRSRALRRTAAKYNSQALEADALHFSTDIWSSLVVVLGLCGVLAAERLGIPWLMKADAAAALGVALIVVWVSLKLGRKSINDVLDAVPEDLQDRVKQAVAAVAGVEEVRQVRLRRSGPEIFADVTLTVWHAEGLRGAHEIADRAEEAIKQLLPGVDVVVHVEPGLPPQSLPAEKE